MLQSRVGRDMSRVFAFGLKCLFVINKNQKISQLFPQAMRYGYGVLIDMEIIH